MGDGLGDLRNAQAGGVAAQNGVLRHDTAQLAVELVLDLQLFQNGFHQKIGVCQILDPGGEGDTLDNGGGLFLGQLAAGHFSLLVQGNHVSGLVQRGGEQVIEPDGVSGGGKGLCQRIAHGACSGNGDAADLFHGGALLKKCSVIWYNNRPYCTI